METTCAPSHLRGADVWGRRKARRKKVRVPDDVTFRTKPEIALAQIRTALAAGVYGLGLLMGSPFPDGTSLGALDIDHDDFVLALRRPAAILPMSGATSPATFTAAAQWSRLP